MKVKSLKMQNFRGFENLTLDFSETEPTVLIGVNGAGKTAILDSIAMLLFCFVGNVLDKKIEGIRFAEPRQEMNSKDIANKADFASIEIVTNFANQEISWSIGKSRIKKQEIIDLAQLLEQASKIRDNFNSNSSLPILVYYTIHRSYEDIRIHRIKTHTFPQFSAYEESLTKKDNILGNFIAWLKSSRNDINQSQYVRYDENIKVVISALMLMSNQLMNFNIKTVSHPMPYPILLEKNEIELFFDQLSGGEKLLLSITGDIARRLAIANPGLENPLEGKGVVLIDEIELHLHPAWQRQIIPALTRTFPNCQFICTTHSPQVLSELKPESIYCLERTDEGQVIAYHPDNPYGKDSNYILEVLMGVTERPKRIKEQLLELFRLIETGQLEEAKRLQRRLETEIGEDEPEFARADVLIRRREAIGR